MDRSSCEPSIVQIIDRLFCILFVLEFDVNVSNQMISQVVTDVHLFNLAILFFDFDEDILKKVVKMLLYCCF